MRTADGSIGGKGNIIGDWREEVLLRSEANASLWLYVSFTHSLMT